MSCRLHFAVILAPKSATLKIEALVYKVNIEQETYTENIFVNNMYDGCLSMCFYFIPETAPFLFDQFLWDFHKLKILFSIEMY